MDVIYSRKNDNSVSHSITMVAVEQWLMESNIFRIICPAGFVGRNLNSQKLNNQYLTTSVAVGLVVR